MDTIDTAIAKDSHSESDLEKGPLNDPPEFASTSRGSTVAPSSRVFSQAQSETSSSRPKWYQSADRLLSFISRAPSAETEQLPEDPENIVRTLESCPEGYPHLAAFLDSDENFMLYRRFGYLQSRILLHKQDELRELEERLDLLGEKDAADPKTRKVLKSRDLDDKRNGPRTALLVTIEKKFKEYAELIEIAQKMVSLNKPAARDYTSVKNYFDDEAPLCSEDEYYIYRKEDIITLKPGRENAWLDGIIERILQKCPCAPIKYLFRSPEARRKWPTGNAIYYTKSRITILVTTLLALIILLLMIVPIYVLWHLSVVAPTGPDTITTICVLLLFTLAFSGVLSFFTRARRHEVFGAAAGYCAVLVVFISNVGQVNVSSLGH